VREELDRLTAENFGKLDCMEAGNKADAWTSFMFYDAIGGRPEPERIEENCIQCPKTVALLDSIEGVGTAGISCLRAGKAIRPHADRRITMRCHLGLSIPEHCGIRSAGMTRHWEEGKCLVLDTTCIHEAWNRSDRDRYILVLDIAPDSVASAPEAYLHRPTLRSRAISAGQWTRYLGWHAAHRVRQRVAG